MDSCPLVPGAEPGEVAFRRRNTHKATAAIRKRIATPLTAVPAINPLCMEPPGTVVGGMADGLPVEEGVEMDVPEDGWIEDWNEPARHDVSDPLVTLKTLDDMTLADA